MGIPILNIWAQSETAAMGTMWTPEDFEDDNVREKFGSIGRAVGNELRIFDEDSEGKGEIQVKGRNTMMGYLNRPDKTASTFTDDGWLRTGDMGKKDKDGFVFLTGRLKEIMKDAGGEMIAPIAVEEGIKGACNKPGKTILGQAIVVGDGKYYISVLLTLAEKIEDGRPTGLLMGAAKDVDSNITTVEAAAKSQEWEKALASCIAEYNEVAQKRPERVFRYAILPKDITGDDAPELMTPTFKIKRSGVNAEYADLIETCGGSEDLSDKTVRKCGSASIN